MIHLDKIYIFVYFIYTMSAIKTTQNSKSKTSTVKRSVVVKKPIIGWQLPSNKESDKESYVNHIIDVYTKGVKKGEQNAINKLKTEITNTQKSNTIKAKEFAENLFHTINDKYKFKCSNVYLGANGISEFKLLFLISPNNYLSKEFDVIYQESLQERKKLNTDKFHVSVLFIPETDSLDKKKVFADGYTHFYNGKAKK